MADLKMPQLNTVIISGRLLRDPEMKYGGTANTPYIKTGLAIDDGYGDKKKSYFIDIAAFGKLAERMHPELSKGVPVVVRGRLTIDEWTGQDGAKHSRVVVLCDTLDRLSWKENAAVATEPARVFLAPAEPEPEDVPF